jgi:hypothetical protein
MRPRTSNVRCRPLRSDDMATPALSREKTRVEMLEASHSCSSPIAAGNDAVARKGSVGSRLYLPLRDL